MLAKIKPLLDKREFLHLATASLDAVPNVAPKFMVSYSDTEIVLADYTLATTYANLKVNTKVAIPVMDEVTLNGYQIKGHARIVLAGAEHEKFYALLQEKIVALSVERIVRGVQKGRESANFEVCFPEKMTFIVVTVDAFTVIHSTGAISREYREVS